MRKPLEPGGWIGVLGGGQLGRMLALAAARLGQRVHVYDPASDSPAAQVSAMSTVAGWDDRNALVRFGRAVDVVTFEWENVPLAAIDIVAEHRPVLPGRRALEVGQDRLDEKRFLEGCGIAVAPYRAVDSLAELDRARAAIGEGILKTRRLGYDGKGQARLAPGGDTVEAWAAIGAAPAVYEGLVPFLREVSVIAARGLDGAVALYEPGENRHENGILRETRVPATLSEEERQAALGMAERVVAELDYVGVLGLELFVTAEGILANEIAPRVHNSGHWTLDGCLISQFEQHVRAITGWPLGDPARHSDMLMVNLIGDEVGAAPGHAAEPGWAVHLYGKAETRPGRKMGHLNRRLGPAA